MKRGILLYMLLVSGWALGQSVTIGGGVKIGAGTGSSLSLPTCTGTDKVTSDGSALTCAADEVGTPGGGITSLGGQTGGTQTFAKVNDSNVTLTINSATDIHTFTLGWTGALSKARGGTGQDNSSLAFPASGTLMTTATGVLAAQMPAHSGDVTSSSGSVSLTLGSKFRQRPCEVHIARDSALLDTDDETVSCYNSYGASLKITGVRCYANAGSPTIQPILTGGASNSILSSALTCGTAGWGIPVTGLNISQTAGSTIDINITSAGGTAKSIRVVIEREL